MKTKLQEISTPVSDIGKIRENITRLEQGNKKLRRKVQMKTFANDSCSDEDVEYKPKIKNSSREKSSALRHYDQLPDKHRMTRQSEETANRSYDKSYDHRSYSREDLGLQLDKDLGSVETNDRYSRLMNGDSRKSGTDKLDEIMKRYTHGGSPSPGKRTTSIEDTMKRYSSGYSTRDSRDELKHRRRGSLTDSM